jgi:hypothetical protein
LLVSLFLAAGLFCLVHYDTLAAFCGFVLTVAVTTAAWFNKLRAVVRPVAHELERIYGATPYWWRAQLSVMLRAIPFVADRSCARVVGDVLSGFALCSAVIAAWEMLKAPKPVAVHEYLPPEKECEVGGPESAMSGGRVLCDSPDNVGRLLVRAPDAAGHAHMGMCWRYGDWLVTAKHVFAGSELDQWVVVGPNGLPMAVDLSNASTFVAWMDYAAFRFSPGAWADLGLKRCRIAPRISVATARTYQWWGGRWYLSNGETRALDRSIFFLHRCDTLRGCSGAPIFIGSAVVGVHIAGTTKTYPSHNLGLRSSVLPYVVREKLPPPALGAVESPGYDDRWQEALIERQAEEDYRLEQELSSYAYLTPGGRSRGARAYLQAYASELAESAAWADQTEAQEIIDELQREEDFMRARGVEERGKLPSDGKNPNEGNTFSFIVDALSPAVGTWARDKERGRLNTCPARAFCPEPKPIRHDVVKLLSELTGVEMVLPPRSAEAEAASLGVHRAIAAEALKHKDISWAAVVARWCRSVSPFACKFEWKIEITDVRWEQLKNGLNPDAGPGYCWYGYGSSVADVLDKYGPTVREAVTRRLQKLVAASESGVTLESDFTPASVIDCDLGDYVRVMIKDEPHSKAKAKEGRWRLIQAMSIVDLLIEKHLYLEVHEWNLHHWRDSPIKVGMSQMDEDLTRVWGMVKSGLVGSDMTAFDWCQDDDWSNAWPALVGHMYGLSREHIEIIRVRERVVSNRTLVLSDGRVYPETSLLGHATGRFITSERNCWCRLLASFWCRSFAVGYLLMKPLEDVAVMGDDCLDRPYDQEKYQEAARHLGLKVKTWDNEFCGYRYEANGWVNTTSSQAKSLWRYAAGGRTSEVREGLADAFRSSLNFPLWVAKVDALFAKPITSPEEEGEVKSQSLPPPTESNVMETVGGGVQQQPDLEKIALAKRIDALEVLEKRHRAKVEKMDKARTVHLEQIQTLQKQLVESNAQAHALRVLLTSQTSPKPAPKGAGEGGAPAKAAKKAAANTGKKTGDAPSH